MLQSTASTSDGRPALILKSTEEIKASWTNILERRRLFEPDDTVEINDPDGSRLKRMYADWFRDFQEYELTEEQKLKPHSKQTSAFTAYLKNNFGGKAFIMALWQTGITWAPTRSMKEKIQWCFRARCTKFRTLGATNNQSEKASPRRSEDKRGTKTKRSQHW